MFLLLISLIGCDGVTIKLGDDTGKGGTIECASGTGTVEDCDGDGYDATTDCDDYASSVNPSVVENCTDGVDNDCDGATDGDDDACSGSIDADGDGYDSTVDCDDADSGINPGAAEVCGDGIDQNCNGQADDVSGSTWYADVDSDGYGDAATTLVACDQPAGYVIASDDCDDAVATVNPGAAETCDGVDDNCDGSVDEGFDLDADGSYDAAACSYGDDCDDANAAVNPDVIETCNGVDDDCDAVVDDAPIDGSAWYLDADSDGYGDAAATLVACDQPAGYVADATDCNDADGVVHPGAAEVCEDGVDNNCNAADDTTGSVWYLDADLDGYGDAAVTATSCDAPAGYVADATDCDDAEATVSPGAAEACNAVDDDCDAKVDEDFDRDGDGGLDAAACGDDCDDTNAAVFVGAAEACNAVDDDCDGSADEDFDADGDGYVDAAACGDDCDDADADVNPGAAEVCGDALDNNCNAADDASGSTWYEDADGDGYGDAAVSTVSCTAPSGYVTNLSDCDDAAGSVNPVATEACDGADNDCDGLTDESGATGASVWYPDADGDGYGATSPYTRSCSAPAGYVADNSDCDDADASLENDDADGDGDSTCNGDCDDANASLNLDDMDGDGYTLCDLDCDDHERTWHPGAAEVCDGDDNDCDGTADDGLPTSTWHLDMDGDGYGDGTSSMTDCAMPSGTVADATDCDDRNSSVSPGAVETCNRTDDDCDGSTDEGFDADADGGLDSLSCSFGTDCDDGDATVYAGASELCDGVDNDCDGDADEDFDADGDGYASATACAYGDDCDDADPLASPGGYEVTIDATGIDDLCSNGVDNDCDGNVDTADWDCQDDEGIESPDGILNGIDNLVVTATDTICVVGVNGAFESPWDGFDAVLQGDNWGNYSSLTVSYAVPITAYADANDDGVDDVSAWCVDVDSYRSLGTGYWKFRLVSQFAADGTTAAGSTCSTASTSTTWERLDLSAFCSWAADDYCGNKSGSDGCGTSIGSVAEVYYSRGTISPP